MVLLILLVRLALLMKKQRYLEKILLQGLGFMKHRHVLIRKIMMKTLVLKYATKKLLTRCGAT
uniref:Uncharacterized protein n=1 Tax=uncultured marine virus TaxID=186617 RepID=A0A0F7L4X3_9VIRU|nr:hypothetical protein Clocel_3545 [uncultured marine virus]